VAASAAIDEGSPIGEASTPRPAAFVSLVCVPSQASLSVLPKSVALGPFDNEVASTPAPSGASVIGA
jgi:hypothetical protein